MEKRRESTCIDQRIAEEIELENKRVVCVGVNWRVVEERERVPHDL